MKHRYKGDRREEDDLKKLKWRMDEMERWKKGYVKTLKKLDTMETRMR